MERFSITTSILLAIVTLFIGIASSLPTVTEFPILRPTEFSATLEEDADTVIIDAEESDSTTNQPEIEFDPKDCLLPKSPGPCRAVIERWYFNSVTQNCEEFIWSGCGGNNNKFRENAQCETYCKDPNEFQFSNISSAITMATPANSNSLTSTTPVPTMTRKHKLPDCPKFEGCSNKCVIIQDRSDRGCKKCLCGTSSGNEKVSPSIKEPALNSSDTVSGETPGALSSVGSVSGFPKHVEPDFEDVRNSGNAIENCKLPTRRGTCRGMLSRFRYDPNLKDCFEFHYGGCDGNLNNFVTKEKCLEYCKGE